MKETFTNLNKVFWPRGYTKGDIIGYYRTITPYLLPYLKHRPIVLNRFPDGIQGEHFFQKNVREKLPRFVETITLRAGNVVIIPKGARHHLYNSGSEALFFLTVYALPQY